MIVNKTTEELLEDGYVKVGSKTYYEYWKKGSEIITIPTNTKENILLDSYNKGYEDALRAIKINLEHFKKDVYSITMIYEGCDMDTYEGESECEKLLKENILGSSK
jgi:hypothetical protein